MHSDQDTAIHAIILSWALALTFCTDSRMVKAVWAELWAKAEEIAITHVTIPRTNVRSSGKLSETSSVQK